MPTACRGEMQLVTVSDCATPDLVGRIERPAGEQRQPAQAITQSVGA